ncbi:MAG: DNA polymerase V family protein, partial [Thaumarchaeota archaeon]|nr:DNA polymerase V family protein [Nitrososphaerota archaeon]
YLHRAATKVLKAIETGVEACPKALVVVLQGLLSNNGLYNFDERAAAKTVEWLLQCANASDPSVLLQTLKKVVLSNLTG